MVNDEFYLSLALNEAWKYQGLTYPNPAVGCAVVDKNGALLALSAHKKAGLAHAELEAAKEALLKLEPSFDFPQDPNELHAFITKNHKNLLKNSCFYVTLEPCAHQGKTPSCADLLVTLGVKRVVIGHKDENKTAKGGAQILLKNGIEVAQSSLKNECAQLLEPFLLWQKKSFSFFKIALRLDGSSDGNITSLKSREFVHKMRDCCDLLVVGGNTVRTDRPILDARLIGGQAPDVLICTKRHVDKTAPLFGVGGRKVIIQDSLEFPSGYKNIMVEGGLEFLALMSDRVDWFLIFNSASFNIKSQNSVKKELNLKPIFGAMIENDRFCWYKKA